MTQKDEARHGEKIIVHVDEEIEDLIPGFLEKWRKRAKTLQEALAKGDYGAILILGHKMKGAGGGYGFDALTDIGSCLENAAKEKNAQEIQRWIGESLYYLGNVEVVYE